MTQQIPDWLPVRIIPEIAASSLVRGSSAASPQSQGWFKIGRIFEVARTGFNSEYFDNNSPKIKLC